MIIQSASLTLKGLDVSLCALLTAIWRHGWLEAALHNRVHNHLVRLFRLLDALAGKWESNTLPTPRTRPTSARKAAKPTTLRLPSRINWLGRLCFPAMQMQGCFENFFNSDGFKELLKHAPQAGRLARPWFRMFALQMPEDLKRPPRPKRIRPKKPEPEPLVINPHAHVPWGLGYRITRRLKKSGFTIAPRIPQIKKGF